MIPICSCLTLPSSALVHTAYACPWPPFYISSLALLYSFSSPRLHGLIAAVNFLIFSLLSAGFGSRVSRLLVVDAVPFVILIFFWVLTMLQDLDIDPFAGNHLMVLETPLLRVSRPVAACQRCRAAKIKCDGKLPACTACEKSNRASECSSTNDQFARGKERSYVATLEAKVEKLEKKLAESKARRKSSTMLLDTHAASPRRSSVETVKASTSNRAAQRKEASSMDELVSDFGLL